MKSIIKFVVLLAGITTIIAYLLDFNPSGDIAKDCSTVVEDGINKIKSTATQATAITINKTKNFTQLDSLQTLKNPEQRTKN